MILIFPENGRREKKVKTVAGKSMLVKEDHLNVKSAELMRTLLLARGKEVELARDSEIIINDDDYAAIKNHFKPDIEILITCRSGKTKGPAFHPCDFNSTEDIIKATVDFELVDRVNAFIDTL